MKEIIKTAFKLFSKLILAGFMCGIVAFSIMVIANGVFAKQVGYNAMGVKEGSTETKLLYTYYQSDGEDTEREKYEAEGYTVTETPIKQLSEKGDVIALIVAEFFCLMLAASFIYATLWDIGVRDSNLVKFKHAKADNLKGLKVGLLAIIPSVLLLLFFFFTKSGIMANMPVSLYRFLNSPLYGFIDLVFGKSKVFSEVAGWKFILLFLLQLIIPLIACGSYLLGFNNISLGEKLIYKKQK